MSYTYNYVKSITLFNESIIACYNYSFENNVFPWIKNLLK